MHLVDVADRAAVGEKGCHSSRSHTGALPSPLAVVGTLAGTGVLLECSHNPAAKPDLSALLASSPISHDSNSAGRARPGYL